MRNKGAIILVAILLALVCLYHLSFTFVAWKVEKDATEFATDENGNVDPAKEKEYLKEKSAEDFYLWRYNYQDCKEQELNLGLDLKGGMNVVLEISVIDVIASLAGDPSSESLQATISRAKELQKENNRDFVELFGEAFDELYPGGKLSSLFLNPEMPAIQVNTSNEEVLRIIAENAQGAIDNSFQILRKRIDRFGVTQPNIQLLESTGRIIVELPGIDDQERVRKLLQGTASLEFWKTYENREVYQYLLAANEKIVEMERIASGDSIVKDSTQIDTTKNLVTDLESNEPDLDTTSSEESMFKDLLAGDGDDELDTASNDTSSLLNEMDEQDPDKSMEDYKKSYPLFALLSPMLNEEGQLFPGAAVGYAHKNDTAKVNDYLNRKQVRNLFPNQLRFFWEVKGFEKSPDVFKLYALKADRGGKPSLEGDVIEKARQTFGQNSASAEVSMQMNSEGAKIWKLLTKEAAGDPENEDDNKQIAVVLDGYVYSSPRVSGEIPNGSSAISGNFTIEEAKDLANVLKSGKMPAPATIISEEVVGPSLGADNIRSGLISFLIAFVVVLIYMMFYYNKAGIVADIALIANVFFIMGVLASLGAVLTLPGIAGIVLTIGMSVDANVLIYERIREEVSAGKGIKLAISDGYKNALSAIIDANVTTILTGIVLFVFGTGPIQGFATTLIIGILTSLFSALFITRLIFIAILKRNKDITFSTRFTENAFKKLQIKFIEKRKIFYVISGIIVLIGIGSLATRGLNAGVDFTGGRSYIVKFEEGTDVNTEDVKKNLETAFEGITPEVKTFGSSNQVKITTKYLIEENGVSVDSTIENKMYHGLQSMLPDTLDFKTFINDYRMQSYKVGPTIVDEIIWKAIMAVAFSLIIIFVYILIRFRNWQFGLGALAALVHDVMIILALFSIFYNIMPFSLEIDQAFIAAILTVVGYSINDTVVVFDRIREYLGLYKKRERTEILNAALNSTLSRTFSTSLSTFVVLLTIFIFGGDVIRGFIFALMVGVVVGTYSSLFIATPVVFDTIRKKEETVRVLKGRKKR